MYRAYLITIVLAYLFVSNAIATENYLDRNEVKSFIDEFSKQYQYPKASLTEILGKVKTQTKVLEAIRRPAEKKKNWQEYRKIFVTSKRIKEGLQFWTDNAQTLALAERKYGVPPEIIVAILGVETFYGRYEGKFHVLDSLVTLGFDYPPRQKFFRTELEQFLLLAKEENLDPNTVKGSYAGAMGKSQFISSSYRQYAVDFDENGKRDLWQSNEDVIGSVANYFKHHGWRTDEPVTFPVSVQGARYIALLDKGIKPSAKATELSNYDIDVDDSLYEQDLYGQKKVALLELNNNNSNEYWAGFNNFYVITRYNHSHMYAMAVYQLSQKIKQDIKDYVAQK